MVEHHSVSVARAGATKPVRITPRMDSNRRPAPIA